MTSLLIYWIQQGNPLWAGLLLGFAVHFKIYPFIYTPSILLVLDAQYNHTIFSPSKSQASSDHPKTTYGAGLILRHINKSRIQLCIGAAMGFFVPSLWMYHLYGQEFLQHSYLHHFSRLDHRHNFSPYHMSLYLTSALPKQVVSMSSLAFIPQLLLAGIVIPLALYAVGKDLGTIMFAQTFAFVAFNKVCTSQVHHPYYSELMESISCGTFRFYHFTFPLLDFCRTQRRVSLRCRLGFWRRLPGYIMDTDLKCLGTMYFFRSYGVQGWPFSPSMLEY
jgi:phosphatidylinositol glycan class M